MDLGLARVAVVLFTFLLSMDGYAGRPIDSFDFDYTSLPASNCLRSVTELAQLLSTTQSPPTALTAKARKFGSPQKVLFTLIDNPPSEGWQAFALKEYGQKIGADAFRRLNVIHPDLVPLIASPGIVNALDDFELFAKGLNTKKPINLRKSYTQFKKKMGTETYYRGLTLTPDEFKGVMKDGFVPRFYRINGYLSDMKDYIRKGIGWGVGNHLQRKPFFTLSVTKEPEIALCVAKEIQRNGQNRGLFLFEVELPVIEAFGFGKKLPYPSHADPIWNERVQNGISLELRMKNNLALQYELSPRVESFVVGGIERKQIKKVWLAPQDVDVPTYSEGTWVRKKPNRDSAQSIKTVRRRILSRLEAVPID